MLIVLFGRRLGEPKAGYLATAMTGAAFLVTVGVYVDLLGDEAEERSHVVTLFEWLPVGTLHIDMAFLADPLSITMCLFVTGIGSLIHLYAIGYMHGDPKFSKFFLYLNLFAFSMLMLVLGENLLVTFLGWEGVGTCSYFLISFWHTRDSAATAGKKAFVTNRVGDFGFMLAMFLAFQAVGSVSYAGAQRGRRGRVAGPVDGDRHRRPAVPRRRRQERPAAAVLLAPRRDGGPDARVGADPRRHDGHGRRVPHGAVNPVLTASAEWVPTMIAWVGVITALFAATVAVAQNDIKRVLAYSTVSQLGYMFLAVGSGAYVAAIFHMVTHAFFKALMFLGSGSVIHGMHEEQDMRRMGLLRKFMPVTAATFIVGWLAIAGVPPFAGFWSKDEILLFALAKSPALYIIGLVTALLTAFYMTRQVVMVFFGKARWEDHAAEHGAHGDFKPHESPPVMLAPLVLLAGLSIVGGIIQLPNVTWLPESITHRLEHWLEPVIEFGEAEITETWGYGNKTILMILATAAAVLGIVIAWLVYERGRIKANEPAILANGWYYDSTVSAFMGGPGRRSFDGAAWFDRTIVDGAVNGSGQVVRATAGELRKGQSGFVRGYAAIIGIGVVGLLAWFVVVRGML